MKVSRGTPQQFLNAVERKIQELGGDLEVNSSTVDSACNSTNIDVAGAATDNTDDYVTYDVVEASDDDVEDVDQLEDGEYIQGLKATCDSKLEGSVDSTTWSEDDDNLYLTVAAADEVHDFTIPRADLTNDEDTDTDYICSYVSDTLE